MSFELPDRAELQQFAREFKEPLDDAAADSMLGYMQAFAMGFQFLDQAQPELPPVKYGPRDFQMPTTDGNQLGAWVVNCNIEGASNGPLKAKRFAVKDNVLVAGLPMLNGTSYLEGLTPEFDATVVTRLLDAGATLVGKTACEYFNAS